MSEQAREPQDTTDGGEDVTREPGEYGSLSVEDTPGGTEDPADLAGTAGPQDADVAYRPDSSEADELP